MSKWKIAFWTPGNMPVEDGKTFGCAAHGFCTQEMWVKPDDKANCIWEKGLTGISVAGTYAEALEKLKAFSFVPIYYNQYSTMLCAELNFQIYRFYGGPSFG